MYYFGFENTVWTFDTVQFHWASQCKVDEELDKEDVIVCWLFNSYFREYKHIALT